MIKIERIGLHNPWLYPFMAESAKPEILKMAGIADEKAREISASVSRLQRNRELKKPGPVKTLSGTRPARKPDTFERSSFEKPNSRVSRKK